MKINLEMTKPVIIDEQMMEVFTLNEIEDCSAEVHNGMVHLNFEMSATSYQFMLSRQYSLYTLSVFEDGLETIHKQYTNVDDLGEDLTHDAFSRRFLLQNI